MASSKDKVEAKGIEEKSPIKKVESEKKVKEGDFGAT